MVIYDVEIRYISCDDQQEHIGTASKDCSNGTDVDYIFNTPEELGSAWLFESEADLEDFIFEQCEGSYVEALNIIDKLEEGIKCSKKS